ncbi:MAG: hypothetical protein GXP42_13415 [Chloroflexi bacterium]|nr:hypothetical protein [Chloroflexota bacterium]
MRFKIDENLPIEVAEALRQKGFDALTVAEQGMAGLTDAEVSSVCKSENRVIITLDLGFADIRTYPPAQFPGIIVLRLSRQDKQHVLRALERITFLFEREPLTHRLWIVDDTRVRIRG